MLGLAPFAVRKCSASIVATLESPSDQGSVAGVSNIQGWAFSTTPGATLVQPFQVQIDGQPALTVPCCSDRADVQRQYPDAPTRTGFSAVYNWQLLGPSPKFGNAHTIDVLITSTVGESTHLVASFNAYRYGDASFLTNLQWGDAETGHCRTVNNPLAPNDAVLVCTGIVVTNSAGKQQSCPPGSSVTFDWDRDSQSFRLSSSCTPNSSP